MASGSQRKKSRYRSGELKRRRQYWYCLRASPGAKFKGKNTEKGKCDGYGKMETKRENHALETI
jgi:hypothetical protein